MNFRGLQSFQAPAEMYTAAALDSLEAVSQASAVNSMFLIVLWHQTRNLPIKPHQQVITAPVMGATAPMNLSLIVLGLGEAPGSGPMPFRFDNWCLSRWQDLVRQLHDFTLSCKAGYRPERFQNG